MYMEFDNEADCIACEAQITTLGAPLMVEHLGYTLDENGSIVMVEGKQPTTRWSKPRKAYGLDRWVIPNPKSKYPDFYKELIAGFTFKDLEKFPTEWVEPMVNPLEEV